MEPISTIRSQFRLLGKECWTDRKCSYWDSEDALLLLVRATGSVLNLTPEWSLLGQFSETNFHR